MIITVAAGAALVATLLLPILRIYGTSMAPTLEEKDIVVAVKTNHIHQGELVAFYFNNKILVKRVIAGPGDWVDIDEAGNVNLNGRALDEPYLISRSKGQTTDIQYPYQVPDGKYFGGISGTYSVLLQEDHYILDVLLLYSVCR